MNVMHTPTDFGFFAGLAELERLQDDYERHLELWQPTGADYAHAFDAAAECDAFLDALSRQVSRAQGRVVGMGHLLDELASAAYIAGGQACMRRVSEVMGRAVDAAGSDEAKAALRRQLQILAERDWEGR